MKETCGYSIGAASEVAATVATLPFLSFQILSSSSISGTNIAISHHIRMALVDTFSVPGGPVSLWD
jgi:hypothetical protein